MIEPTNAADLKIFKEKFRFTIPVVNLNSFEPFYRKVNGYKYSINWTFRL